MSEHTALETEHRTGTGTAKSRHIVALAVIVLITLSITLLLHGIAWWYSPLALGSLIAAHVGIPAFLLYLSSRQRKHSGSSDSYKHDHSNPSSRGRVLRLPHFYDVLARIVTMGREQQFRRWSLDLASLKPGMSVLDLGCGTGSLLIEAAEQVGEQGCCAGFDPSSEMIDRAREKASRSGRSVEFEVGFADHIEREDQSVDVVFSTLVFHHLPAAQHEAVVGEIARVLRPGGRVVLVDWQKPASVLRAMAYPMFLIYVLHQAGPAQSPLDTPTLRRAFEQKGFKVERTSYGRDGVVGALVANLHSGG